MDGTRPHRVLLLGGTAEAAALAERLARDPAFSVTYSWAGRTGTPRPLPVPTRSGGFGGVEGLTAYLRAEEIAILIDATHPHAVRISHNARAASQRAGVPLFALRRPLWQEQARDRWQRVGSAEEAAESLGHHPRRVFLTIGRQDLAPFRARPWHFYLIRSVEPPPADRIPPGAEVITARGPFSADEEMALLASRRIEILVSKNSGAAAVAGKLAAARRLGLPVVMIEPPAKPAADFTFADAETLHRGLLCHFHGGHLHGEDAALSEGTLPLSAHRGV
jgi:precorrin-6A/cobalt-precorrin-6A reductase